MNFYKAGYKILKVNQNEDLAELKHIEKIARVCYKSEKYITDDGESAKKMVAMLIKNKHLAMLEHASFVFEMNKDLYNDMIRVQEYFKTRYNYNEDEEESFLRFTKYHNRYIVSGNLRAWYNWFVLEKCGYPYFVANYIKDKTMGVIDFVSIMDKNSGMIIPITDFTKLSKFERLVHQDLSVQFTVDRGVTHEMVRHRIASFAQESTRYVNYSLDKFGNEINVIDIQRGIDLDKKMSSLSKSKVAAIMYEWVEAMKDAEEHYLKMIELGASPQIARGVLPTSTKAEITITANLKEWIHFFNLRAIGTTGTPHPQMLEVAVPLYLELKKEMPEVFANV